jgi:hypothetical protein
MRFNAAAVVPKLSTQRVFLVTVWAGSIWTLGYLVAPMLFATLADRALAGTIAGSFFRAGAYLSLVCGGLLLMLLWADRAWSQRRIALRLVAAMLVCVLIGYFGLQPMMAALREAAGPRGVMEGSTRMQFGILHGVSSLIYLVQSVLAVVLVLNSQKH